MKRAKTIEAVLSVVVCTALVFYGLFVLRDLREIGPIVPDSQMHLNSLPTAQGGCNWFCQIIVAWFVDKAADYTLKQMKENGCNGPCGGGGGGDLGPMNGCEPGSNDICRNDTYE
jgi:hypothetical protein